jgi:hypothetical protein
MHTYIRSANCSCRVGGWVRAVHSLVQQQPIVDYMATVVCIAPLMMLMSRAAPCLGLAAETLRNLFERQNPDKGTSPKWHRQ